MTVRSVGWLLRRGVVARTFMVAGSCGLSLHSLIALHIIELLLITHFVYGSIVRSVLTYLDLMACFVIVVRVGFSCRVWCGNLSRFMKLIDNYWWQQSVVLNLHLVMATLV